MAYELRIRQKYGNDQEYRPVGRWDLKRDATAAAQSYPADVYDVEIASVSDAAPEPESAQQPEAAAAQADELAQLRARLAAAEAANARKDAELAAVRAATEQQANAAESALTEHQAGEQPAEPSKGL